FKPQPWEQLIRVLREIGYEEGAKRVAIAKQDRIHKSRLVARALHRIYGRLAGYGHRPGRLIAWAFVVAVLGAILFEAAAILRVMAPPDGRATADNPDPVSPPERGGNWTPCQWLRLRGYPSFDPIVYSFDLIPPLIAPQKTKDWAPAMRWKCRQPD